MPIPNLGLLLVVDIFSSKCFLFYSQLKLAFPTENDLNEIVYNNADIPTIDATSSVGEPQQDLREVGIDSKTLEY